MIDNHRKLFCDYCRRRGISKKGKDNSTKEMLKESDRDWNKIRGWNWYCTLSVEFNIRRKRLDVIGRSIE